MLPASQHSDRGRAVSDPACRAESSVPSGENAKGWVLFPFTSQWSVQRLKKRFSTARSRRIDDHLISVTLSKLGLTHRRAPRLARARGRSPR